MKPKMNSPIWKLKLGITFLAIVLVAFLVKGWQVWWDANPMPKDEEMIAHFNAHRAEFEQLITLYRTHPNTPHEQWDDSAEAKALKKRLGVEFISEAPGLGGLWLPNPYDDATVEQAAKLNRFKDCQRYCALQIQFKSRRFFPLFSRQGAMMKSLVHVPQPTKNADGALWSPVIRLGERRYPSEKICTVASSLNRYPPHWGAREMLCRPLEPRWVLYVQHMPI